LHVSGTSSTSVVFERTSTTGTFIALKDSATQTFIGNTNGVFSIQTPGSSYSDKLVVTSAGLVGIGTTSPAQKLEVNGAIRLLSSSSDFNTESGQFDFDSSSGATRISSYKSTGSSVQFFTNASSGTVNERARIDSSGRLLVGTSSYAGNGKLIAAGNTGGDAGTLDICWAGSRPTAANTDIGYIRWYSADNSSGNAHYASIYASSDGASSSGSDIPGRLVFSTTADGGASPTERMRIDNGGNIPCGSTETGNNAQSGISINAGGSSSDIYVRHANNTSSGNYYAAFVYNTSVIGSITQNGTTGVAFNTSSDYRLKENIVPLIGASDRLAQLQVRRFNFISEPDRVVDGFIAHEAQEVVPECVTGDKDAVDDDGNPIYQGIDQSKLVPLLTAALQEAIAKIETLEAKVAALEGA
jgi:hypothetical protein